MSEAKLTAFALRSIARSLRGRRRLWSAVVLAVTLAGAAGAAPAGIGPTPPPKPGRVVSSPFPHSVSVTTEAAVEADDGSIVVAGAFGASWTDYESYSESSLALGRFRPDGSADTSFGVAGAVRDDRFGGRVGDVVLDSDGRIVVAGFDGLVPVVARYGPTGRPDGAFGDSGIVRGSPERSRDSMPSTLAARVLADGTIVIVSFVRQPYLTGDPAPGGLTFTRLGSDGRRLSRATRSAPEWEAGGDRAYAAWAEASIQPDGFVVVAGTVADRAATHSLIVIRRFAADGTVDRSFGNAGRTMTRIGEDAGAADVVVAPDGTVVASGASGQRSYAAVRFRPNGTLDRAFASDGIFALDLGEGNSGAEHVALTADGGIVLAGRPGVTVVRLDRDGRLVRSFGVDGRATMEAANSIVTGVVTSRDGGVRVAATWNDARFRLVRFDATGRAFTDADAEIAMALPSRGADAGVVLRRGGVVLAGWIDTGNGIAAHLVRTGSPSESRFGSKARVTLALGSGTKATAVAEWPDGSLLAAGAVAAEDGERWFVAKLTSKGDRDGRFGAGGIVKPLAPGGKPSVVSAVALANGRSELLGRSGDAVLVLRLLGSGARDGAFGDRGAVELPLDTAAGLVVDAAGRSIVGGSAGGALVAVSVDPAGRPGAPLLGPAADAAAGIAVQPDGAVLVAGTSSDGLVVARWTSDGSLDRRFGSDGVMRRAGYDAVGVAVQRDGRIVVAARKRATGGACLLRFLFGGGVDTTFGTDGVACAPSRVVPAAVVVGPGVLYVAGTAETARGTDLALTSFEQVPLAQPVARGVAVARISPGGAARTVIPTATHPVLSPDGRSIAYVGDDDGAPGLFVADADGGRRRRITRSPFEDGSVVPGSAPVWSRDAQLLAFATLSAEGSPQISVVGADGSGLRTVAGGYGPSWGPGRQLAYTADGEVRILDVDAGTSRVLARSGWWPQWSPRGDLILLGSTLVRPDGTVAGEVSLDWPSWKPDGTALVGIDGRRIVAIDVARMRSRTVVARTGVDMRSPTWSGDGRWIAYIRYVGVYQLVIVDARTGRRVLAWRTPGRTFAGTLPVWGRAGVYVGVS